MVVGGVCVTDKRCQKCGKKIVGDEIVLFWSFEICHECNGELAGLIRATVQTFMRHPTELSVQTEMTLTGAR